MWGGEIFIPKISTVDPTKAMSQKYQLKKQVLDQVKNFMKF